MNFKEALIAHLQGQKIEQRQWRDRPWMPFMHQAQNYRVCEIFSDGFCDSVEFRLAPRTILVNGVEVPAPESKEPEKGVFYYVADHSEEKLSYEFSWNGDDLDRRFLERGLVYLDKESAIARAKAMLITQEVL